MTSVAFLSLRRKTGGVGGQKYLDLIRFLLSNVLLSFVGKSSVSLGPCTGSIPGIAAY